MNAINDPPVAAGGSFSTNEDAVPTTGRLIASDSDSANLPRTIVNNGTAVGTAAVDAPTGDFSYVLVPDVYGSADSITFKVFAASFIKCDGGPLVKMSADSNDAIVTITVNPVNDELTFVKGADDQVLEDNGLRSVPAWATQIKARPTNESDGSCGAFPTICNQTLNFIVTQQQQSTVCRATIGQPDHRHVDLHAGAERLW